jgi:hypothetical protein
LCVIPDDGDNMNKYFVVLPKQNWSQFLETISIDKFNPNFYFSCEEFPNWHFFAVIGESPQSVISGDIPRILFGGKRP